MPPRDHETPSDRPVLLITLDTEGDAIWDRPRRVETKNAAFLPRFQALCDQYRFRPTYLTNYEMALSPVFQEFAGDVVARGAGEIGMHLHAWHSPPDHSLTGDDHRHHPYLIEYPRDVMRAKIAYLTGLLEDTFGVTMVSHRAGRWSFDATYAALLLERGYRVDCSVTPYVSWRWTLGDPRRRGGTDFSRCPDHAYFVDPDDITREGTSALLEVPVTIVPTHPLAHRWIPTLFPSPTLMGRVARRCFPVRWLRPNGRNLRHLLDIVDRAVLERRPYIECMLHSSELMPGGSPTFRDGASIEVLYEHLQRLFEHAVRFFRGATVADFDASFRRLRHHEPGRTAA